MRINPWLPRGPHIVFIARAAKHGYIMTAATTRRSKVLIAISPRSCFIRSVASRVRSVQSVKLNSASILCKRLKMSAIKHAAATAKEKAQNVSAKVEGKLDKKKASAESKPEKVLAHDQAGKEEVEAKEHQRKAEAEQIKNEKIGQNRAEKDDIKQDLNARQSAADSAYQKPSY